MSFDHDRAGLPSAFLAAGSSSFTEFLGRYAPDLLPARRTLPAGAVTTEARHGTTIVALSFPGAFGPGQIIGTQHLAQLSARAAPAPTGQLRDAVDAVERQRVLDVLRRCGGNQSQAARELGIARNTLAARLRRWGVDPTQA